MRRWFDRRYERLEGLGEEESSVQRGRDRLASPGRELVVIKEASERLEGEALNRELELLLNVEHPSARRVRAALEADSTLIAIFEHVDGLSLGDYLHSSPDEARRCAIEVLRGLLMLHERGLVHGDLKPQNVLVADDRVKLIDFGLAAPIGSSRRGGTPGYIAPEELQGAPISVAGDLYAFGATFASVGLEGADQRFSTLVKKCLLEDPVKRPASADGALAMLGEVPRQIDRRGRLPREGGRAILERASALFERLDGGTIVVEAPPGGGRTRFISDATRPLIGRRQPVIDLRMAPEGDVLTRLAKLFDVVLDGDPERSAAIALAAASRAGLALVVDDVDLGGAWTERFWMTVTATLAEIRCGALLLVGAPPKLAQKLEGAGAARFALPRFDPNGTKRTLAAAGAMTDEVVVDAIHRVCEGRPGDIGRAALHLAEHGRGISSVADARELLSQWREESAGVITAPVELEEAVAEAERALQERAPRRALSWLEAAHSFDELLQEPSRHPRAGVLYALAKSRCGELDDAVGVILELGEEAPPGIRLQATRWLTRLGRFAEASELGASLLDAAEELDRVEAAALIAQSALALGEPKTADGIAEEALASAQVQPSASCRLLCVQSDAALTQNDGARALELAARARAAATEQADPTLLPQAIAREAAAYALTGQLRRARERYQEAYEAALGAGDVVGLAPYLLNLGAAEHQLGELGSAIGRYQQAAQLAERLDRDTIRAAALVNWAGLLVDIGAREEATPVLRDAHLAAERSGAALYAAQTTLVEATLVGEVDRERGRSLARQVALEFRRIGATRQALEAELLEGELEQIEQGIGESIIERLLRERLDELRRGGLEARARLALSHLHRQRGAGRESLSAADTAARLARESGDLDLEARATCRLAAIHDALGTGAAASIALRAREMVGDVAARLPVGLRERYLADPARQTAVAEVPLFASRQRDSLAPGPARLLALVRRLLLEGSESRLLEAAVDEAVAIVGAERAFLLRRSGSRSRPGRPFVAVARNIGREDIARGSPAARYSRSVAERVLEQGEQIVTTSATSDPELHGARSVLDLGLRSIICLPIRGPGGVTGALYLDHRFESERFAQASVELVQALADIIGITLEHSRLRADAERKARELEELNAQLSRENERRAAEVERLGRLLEQGGAAERGEPAPGGMIGRSIALRQAIEVARRVAPSTLPVLVEGESGTGKELLARFIHDSSPRRSGPFMALNCGAVPDTLLESELFGHVRGAFTGASRDHPGLFRAAQGGTVLLDEIGEMSSHMQPRLLRVLQEGEVWPLGMEGPVAVDVRVIAATNRDLEQEAEAGRFRQDLYFRLVGVKLRLPPLRERLEDVPHLATHFLERFAAEPGAKRVGLSTAAVRELLRHGWPGNVRELEQTLRRAAVLAESDQIDPADFGLSPVKPARREALKALDRELILQTLRACDNNKSRAARNLGVSRSTLHRWLKRHLID